MKKIIVFFIIISVFVFLSYPVFADLQKEETTHYEIWVGNERVKDNHLSGKGWEYNPKTDTLTLSNANIKGAHRGAAIYCGGQATLIVLNGINTAESLGVFITGESSKSYGMYLGEIAESDTHYVFSGIGSLSLKGADRSSETPSTHSYGLYSAEPIEINSNCLISAIGGNCTTQSCGIFVRSWYSIDNYGSINAVSKSAASSIAIHADTGRINNFGSISAYTYSNHKTTESVGIFCTAIENHGDMTSFSADGGLSRAIWADNIVYNFGTITATSGNATGKNTQDSSSAISTNDLSTYDNSITKLVGGSAISGNSYGCSGNVTARGASYISAVSGDSERGNCYGIAGQTSIFDSADVKAKAGEAKQDDKISSDFGGNVYERGESLKQK